MLRYRLAVAWVADCMLLGVVLTVGRYKPGAERTRAQFSLARAMDDIDTLYRLLAAQSSPDNVRPLESIATARRGSMISCRVEPLDG